MSTILSHESTNGVWVLNRNRGTPAARAKLVTELPEVSVEDVIENILIGHVVGHGQSIRAAQ